MICFEISSKILTKEKWKKKKIENKNFYVAQCLKHKNGTQFARPLIFVHKFNLNCFWLTKEKKVEIFTLFFLSFIVSTFVACLVALGVFCVCRTKISHSVFPTVSAYLFLFKLLKYLDIFKLTQYANRTAEQKNERRKKKTVQQEF